MADRYITNPFEEKDIPEGRIYGNLKYTHSWRACNIPNGTPHPEGLLFCRNCGLVLSTDPVGECPVAAAAYSALIDAEADAERSYYATR